MIITTAGARKTSAHEWQLTWMPHTKPKWQTSFN